MTRTISRNHWAAAALTLVAGLGLTACGSEDSGSADDPSAGETSTSGTPSESTSETPTESPSESPTEPAGPACTDVWVAGATLPQKYDGCQDADKDKWVQAMVYHCSSGQRLVTYQRNFYAAKGGVITESKVPLARDKEFQKILTTCGA